MEVNVLLNLMTLFFQPLDPLYVTGNHVPDASSDKYTVTLPAPFSSGVTVHIPDSKRQFTQVSGETERAERRKNALTRLIDALREFLFTIPF